MTPQIIKTLYGRELIPYVFDSEWTYGTGYSLKQLSYSEYAAHPKVKPEVYSWKWPGEEVNFSFDFEELNDLPWEDMLLICHNNLFDAYMLWHRYKLVPAAHFCTLSATRALHTNQDRYDLHSAAGYWGIPSRKAQLKGALDKVYNSSLFELDEADQLEFITYAIHDTELAFKIAEKAMPLFIEREAAHMDISIKMGAEPMLQLDETQIKTASEENNKARKKVFDAIPFSEKECNSPIKFPLILDNELKKLNAPILHDEPNYQSRIPHKFSEKKQIYVPAIASDDIDFLRLRGEYPSLKPLIKARLTAASNIIKSRLDRMDKIRIATGGYWPAGYQYAAAHTLRVGGSGFKANAANLNRKGGIRQCVIAPTGYLLGIADFAQIEARFAHGIANQIAQLLAYAAYDAGEGKDPYSLMATDIYGYEVDRKRYEMRNGEKFYPQETEGYVGKQAELMLQYGAGWNKFGNTLRLGKQGPAVDISDEEAKRIVYDVYRPKNQKLVDMWATLNSFIPVIGAASMKHGFNKTTEKFPEARLELIKDSLALIFKPGAIYFEKCGEIDPFPLQYPGIHYDPIEEGWFYAGTKKLYGGVLMENITQRLARDRAIEDLIVIHAMLVNEYRGRAVMQTYDENIGCWPEEFGEEPLERMEAIMQRKSPWMPIVPMNSDGKVTTRYEK